MAQLGWIAGPLSMLMFASITLISTFLLSNCYRSPDPDYGPTRNRSYLEAVELNLGNGVIKGSIEGISTSSAIQKGWLVSQALGDIAFAYPYAIILIEIQLNYEVAEEAFWNFQNMKDTLKSPPPENETMKKASIVALCTTTFFYLCCGGFGYAAFGDQTPGNLLTGFGFYEPYWLIDFANACIVLHLVGGYQVYSQPLFAVVEKWFAEKFPNSRFVNNSVMLKLPLLPALRLNLLRLCFRTAYVASTTAIAIIFPYFNQAISAKTSRCRCEITIVVCVTHSFPWLRATTQSSNAFILSCDDGECMKALELFLECFSTVEGQNLVSIYIL
ncbi:hypothetical protein RJ639_015177 [Escallonia herrerae]|uniref:Amino acid transporter transmembrane domain-containing protein n=1 Tax=Escallonia herrerae TaxID=1293975 RepID=A0AA88VKD9_9ASTE|nr:hypothetical protein RJ639_015177 [Escallonia herrerae]